ncbi:histidinol phosphatase [Arenibacter sp. 6A1]|uniref:tyrosine-protein phosphatase n=1 Tax=Arenibacter sp. 6A1 TaxID=2720391 RepID=UPI001446340A|nr:CpsB/CapC family capsule biosynthesis tyrosine phosphatase [Arenibacter sp. 6A1]NKI27126.1 histidinol phosphatase [Arenibacter sp. 6A1]
MFHFFSKKTFLADYLGGFTDIHNHIIPGIDDGAKTVADAVALIKGFSEIGVQKFIATPHIMDNYYPNNSDTITNALSSLTKELTQQGMTHISIDAAAEHMIDANFEVILENNQVMPMKNRYMLIEMSYLQPSINFDQAVQKITEHRYFPILAHPERYAFFPINSPKLKSYKNNGIALQLNLLSLSEYYGIEVQKKAHKLLSEGLLDFAGSDVHNQKQLNSLKEMRITNKTAKLLMPIIEKTKSNF